MPAAYAHNRFGSDCIETLPDILKNSCLEYRDLFDFGVHGPDIFFYYDPLTSNEVNRFGSDMHHRSGRDFFEKCCKVYQNESHKKAMMAYLLGFLAHFTLDSCCHGYINQMDAETDLSHNRIESQYEAHLMKLDGKNPLMVDRSESLKPSPYTAMVIASFFDFTPQQVLKSLKGQRTTMKLFYSPLEVKKKSLQTLIRTLKIGGSFDDLFLDADTLPACVEMNRTIDAHRIHALSIYPELAWNLVSYLAGRQELGSYFDHDFEGGIITEE